MHRVLLGLAAVCVLGASGFAALVTLPGSAAAITNCDTNSASLDSAELEMLQLVNDARAASGAAPLAVSPNLNRAAAWKSEDPGSNGTNGFSHKDSLGRWPEDRAPDCGYAGPAAENVAYGYGSVRRTFDAFMGSPGHRASILNLGYVAIGIGASGDAWTLNFGFIDDSNEPPAPPPKAQATSTPVPTPAAATPSPSRYGVTLKLGAGLNLIGFAAPTTLVQAATASLGDDLVGVYWWDSETKTWLHYFRGVPAYANTLDVLQPGFAYYITIASPAEWQY